MTTSEQARADALADAETLRLTCIIPCRRCGGRGDIGLYTCPDCQGVGVFETNTGIDLGIAGWCGYNWQAQSVRLSTDQLVESVRIGAHAAFRAVPGLRGDL